MAKKGEFAGSKNPAWKGGRVITSLGYIIIHAPNHPNCDVRGYYPEHRIVMEKKLGRILRHEEQVHHIDGNKGNNSPENLMVVSDKEHKRLHAKRTDLKPLTEENVAILCSCGCGNKLEKYDNRGRPRKTIWGHNRRKIYNG